MAAWGGGGVFVGGDWLVEVVTRSGYDPCCACCFLAHHHVTCLHRHMLPPPWTPLCHACCNGKCELKQAFPFSCECRVGLSQQPRRNCVYVETDTNRKIFIIQIWMLIDTYSKWIFDFGDTDIICLLMANTELQAKIGIFAHRLFCWNHWWHERIQSVRTKVPVFVMPVYLRELVPKWPACHVAKLCRSKWW